MIKQSNFKIKRHKRVYQGAVLRRIGAFKMVGGILLLCVLFFVGYSVAEPVMSFLSGDMRIRLGQQSNASSQLPQSSSQPSSVPSQQTAGTVAFSEIKALFMPNTVLADDARFEAFVTQAKTVGANTIVISVKDASGVIYYNSALSQPHEIGAVMEDTPDITKRIETLSEQGIQTIAHLHAFKDPLAARKIKGAAVRYSKDVTTNWLDNYPTEGGKPWINPESTEGMSYVTSLIAELAQSGAAYVMVDSLHYPTGVGLNLAYFGPKSNDSRTSVLNGCITQIENAIKDSGCKLIVTYEAGAYLDKSELIYGGDPAEVSASVIAPLVLPSGFESGITIGKTRIADPATQAYEVTKAFLEYLLADVATGTKVLPVVSTDSGQLSALGELDVTPYILYSMDGKYE